jgi:hypothetical protein
MTQRISIVQWIWKLSFSALAYVVGAMLGGLLVTGIGLEMPRPPVEVDSMTQSLLLFPAGFAYALGLAAMAAGLSGRRWERWLVLTTFLFAINGIGNAIEATMFTTLGGQTGGAVSFLLPSALCALAVTILFPAPSEASLAQSASEFFSRWSVPGMAFRFVIAIGAFPVVYFFFGMIVAPIVTPYYAELDFLKIPPMSTLVPVLFARSALIFLVTLPIIAGWRGSRTRLIVGLALGNATAVGLGGLVQAPFFPAVLRWAHGIEILADGIAYAWILALLFVPRARLLGEEETSTNRTPSARLAS